MRPDVAKRQSLTLALTGPSSLDLLNRSIDCVQIQCGVQTVISGSLCCADVQLRSSANSTLYVYAYRL